MGDKIIPRVGMVLYGCCDGVFYNESYEDKRIEVVGYDYIVVRLPDGSIDFSVNYDGSEYLIDEGWLDKTMSLDY